MKERCIFCGKVRIGKWALLFSPPIKLSPLSEIEHTQKSHVCPACYFKIYNKNYKSLEGKP
jgi:hypothetical protein